VKIRLLVWCEGYLPSSELRELDSKTTDWGVMLTDFVLSEVNKDELLRSFEDSLAARLFNRIEDFMFDLPDNLDEQFIHDICVGRSCSLWLSRGLDFNKNYLRSWMFIENNNKWDLSDYNVQL
jgi:hypothetical protein